MKTLHLLLIFIAALLPLLLGCNSFELEQEDFLLPDVITVHEIELIKIPDTGPLGREWDDDGNTPDVFMRIWVNNRSLRVTSDTLDITDDFTTGSRRAFQLTEPFELTQEDTIVRITLEDYDKNPNLPEELQTNDHIASMTWLPWAPRNLPIRNSILAGPNYCRINILVTWE